MPIRRPIGAASARSESGGGWNLSRPEPELPSAAVPPARTTAAIAAPMVSRRSAKTYLLSDGWSVGSTAGTLVVEI